MSERECSLGIELRAARDSGRGDVHVTHDRSPAPRFVGVVLISVTRVRIVFLFVGCLKL